MSKINRLFRGELKKIFSSLSVFLMMAFLILVLTISPKLFSPEERKDIKSNISFSSVNVKNAYGDFINQKNQYETIIETQIKTYQNLIEINKDFSSELSSLAKNIYDLRINLNSLIMTGNNTQMSNCLIEMVEKTEEFEKTYNNYLNEHDVPLILVTEEQNQNITFELESLLKKLKSQNNNNIDFISINDSLENYGCTYNLWDFTKAIKNIKISNENLQETLDDILTKKEDYKLELFDKIQAMYDKANLDENYNVSDKNIKEIKSLSYKYIGVDYNKSNILQDRLKLEVTSYYSNSELSTFKRFEGFNRYEVEEKLCKSEHLLNNNYIDTDFANVFSFNKASIAEDNAFDYMFFTMELISILIIAFTVIIGAGIVAKEFSEGTIKLLVMKPFNREKIIFSKILATIFLSFLMLIASTVISSIIGVVLYGISFSQSSLVVINASLVFSIPTWCLFLIYLGCLFLKILIYTLLAIAISTIFKSHVISVCISVGIYLINLVITYVSKGAGWLKYNIFANIDLFKYFGGSFYNSYSVDQNLSNLFVSPVFFDTSIWLTIGILGGLAIFLNVLIFSVFKHRDIS